MDLKTEAIAGVTTFFTMSYIVVVNPTILSTPGTGMAFSGVLTATVLICFSMTLLMGLYAKAPVRGRARHGHQRLLHVHDHLHSESLVAGRTRNCLLGRRVVSADLSDAGSRNDRESDPVRVENRNRRGHRHLSDVHRSKKRRSDYFGSGHVRETRTSRQPNAGSRYSV